MNTTDTYNGWKNRSTWNAALWINNDYSLYHTAVEFMRERKSKARGAYRDFIKYLGLENEKTPDGTWWLSRLLDYTELDNMMGKLVN